MTGGRTSSRSCPVLDWSRLVSYEKRKKKKKKKTGPLILTPPTKILGSISLPTGKISTKKILCLLDYIA
ncbi:hypothetical protein NQ317_012616 [Molorchus minor]|uniref:Uncharacterized protein n=1 Tax=Molorchus minor TaxID=1323400 RepID=A0ABQ9JJ55_9CUCU|nr:hypothetical protein NQ317_012616 [Molorchus minor]